MTVVYGEIVPYVKTLAAGRENLLHEIGKGIVGMENPSFTDYLAAEAKAETLRSAFAGYLEKYDVLLCPVNPMTATPHGAQELIVNGETVSWLHVMKATSPFNIQLVARWLD